MSPGLLALSEGEWTPPPPTRPESERRCASTPFNTHEASHPPHPEGQKERENEKRDEEGPMSRCRSSHGNADTNPGSVPLAPACHKSDKRQPASQGSRGGGAEGRRPNREVKWRLRHTALIRQLSRDKLQPLSA